MRGEESEGICLQLARSFKVLCAKFGRFMIFIYKLDILLRNTITKVCAHSTISYLVFLNFERFFLNKRIYTLIYKYKDNSRTI